MKEILKQLYSIEENLYKEVFKRLNNLRRWTSLITEDKYNELAKQALNCIVCFILAIEYEFENGVCLDWTKFPKIALFRAYQKVFVNYDIPEKTLHAIGELGNITKETYIEVTKNKISKKVSPKFSEFLVSACGTREELIYKAATKLATFVELQDIRQKINGEFDKKYGEIICECSQFKDLPGFSEFMDTESSAFKAIKTISHLRNQNRWAAYSYRTDCSVLGHLFDTAIFSYLISLEEGYTEEIASKNFFIGIFHDVPETFTMDIPSPIKDGIPGFRKLSEAFELMMMEEKLYPSFPKYVQKAIKDVMLEEEQNTTQRSLIKGADYMSAATEIWRQACSGSRDSEFYKAVKGQLKKFESGIAKIGEVEKRIYMDISETCKKCFIV